jgi:hypothetical protein
MRRPRHSDAGSTPASANGPPRFRNPRAKQVPAGPRVRACSRNLPSPHATSQRRWGRNAFQEPVPPLESRTGPTSRGNARSRSYGQLADRRAFRQKQAGRALGRGRDQERAPLLARSRSSVNAGVTATETLAFTPSPMRSRIRQWSYTKARVSMLGSVKRPASSRRGTGCRRSPRERSRVCGQDRRP